MDINEKWQQSKKRFFLLWQQFSNNKNNDEEVSIRDVWETLTTKYSEPDRFYHTREHILDCLNQFDKAVSQMPNPDVIEMAIWFHDVVYDTKKNDNEDQSAILFERLSKGYMLDTYITKVCDLILATKHIDHPADEDQAFLLDIDLSSIASNWQQFTRDNSNLRKEVSHLSNEQYCKNKTNFFNVLLAKERIFFTKYFYNSCETRARKNMENFIKYKELASKFTNC